MDGSYQSLEALPVQHLQIVFVASSSCSEDDGPVAPLTAPVCQQQRPAPKKSLPNGVASPALPKAPEVRAKVRKPPSRTGIPRRVSAKDRGRVRKGEVVVGEKKKEEGGVEEEVLDAPPDGFPLRRVISIEEDHLPHLLHGGPQPLLHQLSEEDDDELEDEAEEEATSDIETSVALAATPTLTSCQLQVVKAEDPPARKSRFSLSSRGQPVGKETQQVGGASSCGSIAANWDKTKEALMSFFRLITFWSFTEGRNSTQ